MNNNNNYGTYEQLNKDSSKISCDEIFFQTKNLIFDFFIQLYTLINIPTYTEIIPNLYVGNITAANNEEIMRDLNISTVISVINEREVNNYFGIEYHKICVYDNLKKSEINTFYNCLDYNVNLINDNIQNDKKVFVHCYRGCQRSCSLVAAYLMKYQDMSYSDTIRYIKKKHKLAFLFFPHFRSALVKYENDIKEKDVWYNL
jgi:hypothetical protein